MSKLFDSALTIVSVENMDEIIAEETTPAEALPEEEVIIEEAGLADEATDVVEDADEITEVHEGVDELINDSDDIDADVAVLEDAMEDPNYDGADSVAIEMLASSVRRVNARLQGKIVFATECYGLENFNPSIRDRREATRVAIEEAKEASGGIVKTVINMLKRAVEWVKEFLASVFTASGRAEKRLKSISAALGKFKAEDGVEGDVEVSERIQKMFSPKGAFTSGSVEKMLKHQVSENKNLGSIIDGSKMIIQGMGDFTAFEEVSQVEQYAQELVEKLPEIKSVGTKDNPMLGGTYLKLAGGETAVKTVLTGVTSLKFADFLDLAKIEDGKGEKDLKVKALTVKEMQDIVKTGEELLGESRGFKSKFDALGAAIKSTTNTISTKSADEHKDGIRFASKFVSRIVSQVNKLISRIIAMNYAGIKEAVRFIKDNLKKYKNAKDIISVIAEGEAEIEKVSGQVLRLGYKENGTSADNNAKAE